MKRFSNDDVKRLGDLADELRGAWKEVEETKDAISEAVDRYNEALGSYNEQLQEARGVVEDLAAVAQAYADERSEKWAEGDAGSNYMDWINEMEGLDLEDIDPIEMSQLDFPDEPEHADNLENLQREPGE